MLRLKCAKRPPRDPQVPRLVCGYIKLNQMIVVPFLANNIQPSVFNSSSWSLLKPPDCDSKLSWSTAGLRAHHPHHGTRITYSPIRCHMTDLLEVSQRAPPPAPPPL